MILVKVFFNTDHEGNWINSNIVELDDMPQCWYGPFDDISEAISFMENDYPEDDTDVLDIIADDFEVPADAVINDPVEFRKQFEEEDVRDDSQELHGP